MSISTIRRNISGKNKYSASWSVLTIRTFTRIPASLVRSIALAIFFATPAPITVTNHLFFLYYSSLVEVIFRVPAIGAPTILVAFDPIFKAKAVLLCAIRLCTLASDDFGINNLFPLRNIFSPSVQAVVFLICSTGRIIGFNFPKYSSYLRQVPLNWGTGNKNLCRFEVLVSNKLEIELSVKPVNTKAGVWVDKSKKDRL